MQKAGILSASIDHREANESENNNHRTLRTLTDQIQYNL